MSFRQGARQFFERRGGGVWQNPYVTDGLVAMWDGEWNVAGGVHDANATTWRDLVGNSDMALFGNAGWTSQALSLDGTISSYASLSDVSSLPSSGDFSFECLCERKDARAVVVKPPDSLLFGLMFYDQIYNSVVNRVSGWTFNDTTFPIDHIGLVSTTFSSGSLSALYVDGANGRTGYSDSISGSQNVLTVGKRVGGNEYPMQGRVFCIRIYSRALTAAEIAANYAIDKARFNLP